MGKNIIIRDITEIVSFEEIDTFEKEKINKAAELLELGYPEHSLIDIWNAASHNLRRRIEAYSVEMFISSISTNTSGRKKYKENGDTLADRWGEVDDHILIFGATQLKLISRKTGKTLEMINWMRNHSSATHDCEDEVSKSDVIGLVQLLASNLFVAPMPDPVHSPRALIDPIKLDVLSDYQIGLFKEQISNYRKVDLQIIYGFSLNQIILGEIPAYENVSQLFPLIWEMVDEESKKEIGKKYYDLSFSSSNDSSNDKKAISRLFEQIVVIKGVKYIPESSRAVIYRELANRLAKAKDTMYGWTNENAESRALAQVGPFVPSSVFEEVYQEILSAWCGNYWGRSEAYSILNDFIFGLPHKDRTKVAKIFKSNKRAREELFLPRPKVRAIELLKEIKDSLKIESQKNEIDEVIKYVQSIMS